MTAVTLDCDTKMPAQFEVDTALCDAPSVVGGESLSRNDSIVTSCGPFLALFARLGSVQYGIVSTNYGESRQSAPFIERSQYPHPLPEILRQLGAHSEDAMHSPYGIQLVEDCLTCKLCSKGFFCDLPKSVMEAFQPIKFTVAYPAGATLFVEGQACRGVYILCRGRVKLLTSSSEGQILILKIAQPGEVLGLNATVSGMPHETTAETGLPCQLNFVKREDFLKFLTEHGDACMHAAIHLSRECQQAYQQLRSFMTSTASNRIARLMLDWSHDHSRATTHGIKVALTHEEIGQIIGMSRETVTRTLSDFRHQRIARIHGSTLLIQNMSAIQKLAGA